MSQTASKRQEDNIRLEYMNRPTLTNEHPECEWCVNYVGTGYKDGKRRVVSQPEWEIYEMRQWLEHRKTHDPKHHRGNGTPNGAFAFTLTMSPADNLTAGDLLIAARKIMTQKSNKVKRYAWYYEDKGKDDNGDPLHPHIHGIYETETGGRIHSKHFQRAWKIWDEKKPMGQGFRGGYHRPVASEDNYDVYIRKSNMLGEKMLPPSIENAAQRSGEVCAEASRSPQDSVQEQAQEIPGRQEVIIREASDGGSETEGGNEICG